MQKTFKQISVGFLSVITLMPVLSYGASLEDIKNRILDRSREIIKLEQEINTYQRELQNTKQQVGGLQGEIKQIDSTRKKLSSDLTHTERTISKTTENISVLSNEIQQASATIESNQAALGEALRALHDSQQMSLVEMVLDAGTLTDFIGQADNLDRVGRNAYQSIQSLRAAKEDYSVKKQLAESERNNLSSLKTKLADQKHLVEQTKAEKDRLLKQTQSQEANYQKLLADRLAKKRSVEAELANIEQELKTIIDPNRLPQVGTTPLSWPVANVRITQYFGNTEFASRNPQVYSGRGHNGIDLGIPSGTELKAAAEGTVIGAGDTDLTCKGASYGKWVLIRHPSGISTLYAHLSLIKVAEGQSVSRGQVIGYSGNTGYSTGPHLHFTVYANQGVQVSQLQSKVPGCGVYRLPVASYNSYLNPLSYLPAL